MAGYTFEQIGSSASFRLLSYMALFVFLVQVSVNRLIMITNNNSAKNTDYRQKEIICENVSEECIR